MTSPNHKQPVTERHRERAAKLWPLLEPALREAARAKGYALGIHGSLVRDFDVIAVPWTTDAAPARDLAEAIALAAEKVAGCAWLRDAEGASNPDFFLNGEPGAKPHGRRVWSFHLGGGPYIDLSVMPRSEREMRITLFAHTEPPPASYPGFCNATLAEDGMVALTVRAPAGADGSCGHTATVKLDRDLFDRLLSEGREALGRIGR